MTAHVLHLGDRVRSRSPVYLRRRDRSYDMRVIEGTVIDLTDGVLVDPDGWQPHWSKPRFNYQDLEVIE